MKQIIFMGHTEEIIASFSREVRRSFGFNLNEICLGNEPFDWKPMKSIGQGVRELRTRDKDGIYRVIYVLKIKDKVHVIHAFQKKTQRTEQYDLDLAKTRFKQILE